jgi:hypothetical protein
MPTADLIITNARVITMDEASPGAEAIAVKGNEILAVGAKSDVEGLKGKGTRLFDAQGSTVTPGLIESHVHLFMGSAELENLDLAPIQGIDKLTKAVAEFAAQHPDDKLVYANSVAYNVIGEGIYVTRQDLDQVLPDRPFAMMGADHHTVWANTKALELAGILHGGDVPKGAEIVMAPDGTATGELREPGAFRYVLAHTRTAGRDSIGFTDAADPDPAPSAKERACDRDLLRRGMKYVAAHGFTSVHNMDGNLYTLELCDEIDKAGDFTIRVQSPFHMKNFFPIAKLEGADEMRRRFASERVYSGRVKLFMDGVMESWTAMTLDEYPDKPGCFGDPIFTAEQFNEIAIAADRMKLQIDVHAIADAAIRRTLDGYEAAMKVNGKRDSRHRIEHVEVIDPADVPRFRELGVIASMQTTHAPTGIVFPAWPALSRIRDRQLPYAYAWSTMREVSPAMPFSSDWPVAPVSPMLSFKAGMVREPFKPGMPHHRQTLMQMIAGYTREGAYTEFAEKRKGMLKAGMLADIAVFSADLERTDPAALTDVKAVLTVADGRVTHEA